MKIDLPVKQHNTNTHKNEGFLHHQLTPGRLFMHARNEHYNWRKLNFPICDSHFQNEINQHAPSF